MSAPPYTSAEKTNVNGYYKWQQTVVGTMSLRSGAANACVLPRYGARGTVESVERTNAAVGKVVECASSASQQRPEKIEEMLFCRTVPN